MEMKTARDTLREANSHTHCKKRDAEVLPAEADEKPDSDSTSSKFSLGRNVEGPPTKVAKSGISSYNSIKSKPTAEIESGGMISNNSQVEVMQDEEFMSSEVEECNDNDENFNYMQIRMKNMKQNEEFLASIGINKAKEEVKQDLSIEKCTVSQRGLSLRVKKEPVKPLPCRKSLRLNRLDPDGNPLPAPKDVWIPFKDCVYPRGSKSEEKFCSPLDKSSQMIKSKVPSKCQDNSIDVLGKVSLTEECVANVVPKKDPGSLLDKSSQMIKSKVPSKCQDNFIDVLGKVSLPEECVAKDVRKSVSLKDCVYPPGSKSEEKLNQFCSLFDESSKCQDNFIHMLGKLSLTEERVAKVVPERVFSLSWHPSTDVLIAAAGDKCGHIGLWNVMATEKDRSDIVTAFKPHIKPVTQLSFSRSDNLKLYSSSYDATLRCLDFQKCVFEEIFSVPQNENIRQFSFVDPNIMLVAHHSGLVSVVDTRTATNSAEHSCLVSKRSVHSIHVNPTSPNHFITAGADSDFNLWDLRAFKRNNSPVPLYTLIHNCTAVSSAYFSPNGQQVLSSFNDNILLLSVENATSLDLHKIIPHKNRTGKRMTKFRPTWHPTVDNIFVSGCKTEQIEIFDSIKGSRVSTLKSVNLNSVCSLNEFHPGKPTTLVGANSTGELHVFM